MGALDSHWTAAAKQPSKCKIKALKGFPEEKFSHRTQNRIKGNNRSKCQELLLEPSKPSAAVDDLMCCCAHCACAVHIVRIVHVQVEQMMLVVGERNGDNKAVKASVTFRR